MGDRSVGIPHWFCPTGGRDPLGSKKGNTGGKPELFLIYNVRGVVCLREVCVVSPARASSITQNTTSIISPKPTTQTFHRCISNTRPDGVAWWPFSPVSPDLLKVSGSNININASNISRSLDQAYASDSLMPKYLPLPVLWALAIWATGCACYFGPLYVIYSYITMTSCSFLIG